MLLTLLTACLTPNNEPKESVLACTDIAIASTNVTLQDPDGNPILGATLTYTKDGSDPIACEEAGNGYICGWEESGDLTITATATGFITGSTTVTVPLSDDGCHPIGQQVTLTLTPETPDCTENIVPSVYVHVTTDAAIPIEGETVMWGLAFADMAPIACEPTGDHYWYCAQEVADTLDIYVSAPNFADSLQQVVVGMDEDGCHVITESLEVSLTPN